MTRTSRGSSNRFRLASLVFVVGCGGRTELSGQLGGSSDAALEADAPVSLCAADAGTLSTFIVDAAIGPECHPFFANVVVENKGYSWIGPITVKTLYLPSGVSWPVSSKGTTPAPPARRSCSL